MKIKSAVAVCMLAALIGCGSISPGQQFVRTDPDQRVEQLAGYWEQVDSGVHSDNLPRNLRGPRHLARMSILEEAEVLALEHPRLPPALLLCAALSYELDRADNAQVYLDTLLSVDPTNAEAAILRSRIALEQGNHPYALRLLDDQVDYHPNHAGLREARASALYMAGRLGDAINELQAAKKLGAPEWRTAYNLGLIYESMHRPHDAAQYFDTALRLRPDHEPARERLKGLESAGYRVTHSSQ